MKLNSFINLYNTKKTDEDKEMMVKSHILNKYVPLEEKQAIAENIINNSYYIKIKNKGEKEVSKFRINSVAKHMLTFLALIDMYTDIELNFSKSLESYNKMMETGIFDIIIPNIDKREMQEFKLILDFVSSDLMINEYEPHAFLKNQIERFGILIGETINPVLKEIDLNKIEEVLKQMRG